MLKFIKTINKLLMDDLKFEYICNENDIIFHETYILCCKIFPNMVPYSFFSRSDVVAVLLNTKLVGFMILDTGTTNNFNFFFSQKINEFAHSLKSNNLYDSLEKIQNNSNEEKDSSDTDELVSKSTSSSDDKNYNNITLLSIGIDKNERGNKFGYKCIEWLKKNYPNRKIELHVSIKNDVAINLYKKCGFKINSTETLYYEERNFEPYTGDGRNAYFMVYE